MTAALNDMFQPYPRLSRSDRISGGPVVVGGKLVLGRRAGPDIGDEFLLHEMAHMIEIDDDRCTAYGWGLKLPLVEVCGQSLFEPSTFQPTLREIRVCGIQLRLAEALGVDISVDDVAQSLQYMPDWWCWKEYFGEKRDGVVGGPLWELHIVQAVLDARETTDTHQVIDEWHRKCELVTRALEVRS